MAYARTTWVDNVTAVNAAAMNNIETELVALDALTKVPAVVNGQFVKGVGGAAVWAALTPADSGLPKITSQAFATGPPGSPADGDIWNATAVDANGTVWMFRYNAGSASAFKWEFIGGAPACSSVLAQESTASVTYVALTTPGPSIALVRAGDFCVSHGALMQTNNAGAGTSVMSYDIGATAAIDGDAVMMSVAPTGNSASVSRTQVKTGLAAATTLVAKYRNSATLTNSFLWRWMSVVPVRVS